MLVQELNGHLKVAVRRDLFVARISVSWKNMF